MSCHAFSDLRDEKSVAKVFENEEIVVAKLRDRGALVSETVGSPCWKASEFQRLSHTSRNGHASVTRDKEK